MQYQILALVLASLGLQRLALLLTAVITSGYAAIAVIVSIHSWEKPEDIVNARLIVIWHGFAFGFLSLFYAPSAIFIRRIFEYVSKITITSKAPSHRIAARRLLTLWTSSRIKVGSNML